MGGTLGVSIGRTDGGTIGRRSIALEQVASETPLMQVHVQAALAGPDERPAEARSNAIVRMRMSITPTPKAQSALRLQIESTGLVRWKL